MTHKLSKRLSNILRDSVLRVLKKEGFIKQGLKYQKQATLLYEISIQKSRWNNKDNIEFTINFSIWPLDTMLSNLPFIFLAPLISGRVSTLSSTEDKWFKLSNDDPDPLMNDNKITDHILQILQNYVIPFFTTIHNLDALAEFLEKNNSYPNKWMQPTYGTQTEYYIAIIACLLNDYNKAIVIIDKLINDPKAKILTPTLVETKEKIISKL